MPRAAAAKIRSPLVPDDTFRRLCHAREFLRACHAEKIALDQAARQAGISPFHFLRLFRQAFGITPHSFLTEVRLGEAKRLLSQHNLPVTEICWDVGFSSLGSFSTLFSREVGCSPAAFRRARRPIFQIPALYPRLFVPNCFWIQAFER